MKQPTDWSEDDRRALLEFDAWTRRIVMEAVNKHCMALKEESYQVIYGARARRKWNEIVEACR